MEYKLRESIEREIKLNIGPRFRLPDIPGEPLAPRVFTSTYFDTPNHNLAKLGITLRRRTENRKVRWQLKLPKKHARLELEISSHQSTPPEPFLDILFGILRHEPCNAVVKLQTKRSGIRVHTINGPLADIVIDRVAVQEQRRTIGRFSEIEIELLDGNENELKRLENLLRSSGAEDGDSRPKAIRALGLSLEHALPPVSASAPPIDHLQSMLQQQFNALILHDPGTRLGKDPEELHQMRVSTRRFRALLRAAQNILVPEWSNPLRSEMGWLGQALGSVRDYDVLLEHLRLEASTLLPEERKIFERVLSSLETKRSIARAQLLAALRSERYLKLLNHLEDAIPHPLTLQTDNVSLLKLAKKEFNKLRREVQHLSVHPSGQDLHKVRIRTKRARYAGELAQSTMGKAGLRYLQQTKRVQDVLGDHQDAIIAEAQLRELLPLTRGVKAAFAMGQVVAKLQARRSQARAAFPREWAKLKKLGRLAFSQRA